MAVIPNNRKIRKEQLKGVVESVTGSGVDNTDPKNPVVTGSGGGVTQTTGTFTPTLTCAGGGATYTLSNAYGSYCKMGKQVFFTLSVVVSSTSGTPSGSLLVNNLPFQYDSLNVGADCPVIIGSFSGSDFTATELERISATIADNESRITIRLLSGNTTAPNITSGNVTISGTYTTDT